MEAINSHHKPIFMVDQRELKFSLNGTQIAKLSKEGNLTFKLVD